MGANRSTSYDTREVDVWEAQEPATNFPTRPNNLGQSFEEERGRSLCIMHFRKPLGPFD